MTSSSAIYSNPNLIKPIPVKPGEGQQHGTQPRPVRPLRSPSPLCVARGSGTRPRGQAPTACSQNCARRVVGGPGADARRPEVSPNQRFQWGSFSLPRFLFRRGG